MIYYAKISTNGSSDTVEQMFLSLGADKRTIIIDNSVAQKQPEGLFETLKNKLLKSKDALVIDAISSLGKNNREISKELQWFKDNNIKLIILNISSTFNESAQPIDVLVDVYKNMADVEIQNVKTQQQAGIIRVQSKAKPYGRKRIPYPDNWESSYLRWKKKEISISEFMKITGLKKGTIYNLIKQYNQQQEIAKQA